MPITLEPTKTTDKVKETDSEVKPKFYPNYRVLLHNDDGIYAGLVVEALKKHIPRMNDTKATAVMLQAHQTGVGEVIVCAQEPAEMYEELLKGEGLPISIEPMEV
jgi:ATP-dependent Clp protease adaptor protein ClpS